MPFVPPRGLSRSMRLLPVVRRLGLMNGLKLCLDAADIRSYPGSGQIWHDQSGNGHHFFRGANDDGGGDAADPTFNGVANTLGAYWSFDGQDNFTIDGGNPAWVNSIHKANAAYTLLVWAWYESLGGTLIGTNANNTSNIGFRFGASASQMIFNVTKGVSGQTALVLNSTPEVPVVEEWNCLAVSVDAATGEDGAFTFRNGGHTVRNASYNDPATGDAGLVLNIGAGGGGGSDSPDGTRIAAVAVWEVALTPGQVNAVWNATRGRFGV